MRLTKAVHGMAMVVFGLLSGVPVCGTVVTYNDRSLWQATTPGSTLINFEGVVANPGSAQSFNNAQGFESGGVRFQGILSPTAYDLTIVNPLSGWGNNFGSGALLRGPASLTDPFQEKIRVTLPVGITSFGADLMSQDPNGLSFNIVLATGDLFSNIATAQRPTRTFFGVNSSTSITYIDFVLQSTGNQQFPLLDNFSYGLVSGAGSPAPGAETLELNTLLYLGTGLFAIWLRYRKWAGAAG